MTRPEDVIGDFPPDVFELCRRHLGIINTITPLATARHDLFQLSGTIGVGVLKVHVDSLNLKSNFDSPDLWQREHTANLLFQEYSQLLDATPGYLLFEFVDAQPLARRLMAETSSSPASFFEQAAVRASEIHRASRELDPSLLGNFPIDPLLALGLGTPNFLSSFKGVTHLLSAHLGVKACAPDLSSGRKDDRKSG